MHSLESYLVPLTENLLLPANTLIKRKHPKNNLQLLLKFLPTQRKNFCCKKSDKTLSDLPSSVLIY